MYKIECPRRGYFDRPPSLFIIEMKKDKERILNIMVYLFITDRFLAFILNIESLKEGN